MTPPDKLSAAISCLSDYDPDALPVASARRIIQAYVSPVRMIERLAIRSTLDRVLALDLVSPIDVPTSDNSAMDGYAVRAADLDASAETRLRLIGSAFAGHAFAGPTLAKGEAVRVMTGAVLPCGSDTIVIQEDVRRDDGHLFVPAGQGCGQNIRRRGEDLRAGSIALPAGKRIGPADLGLMASLGFVEAPVRRRLRVAFFSTGDELAEVGQPLEPGQVYDSNRYTLYGMLERLGVEILDLGTVPDDRQALEEAMRIASEGADAVLSSGGVSVGDADFTREVLSELGEVAFWRLAIRPGRPLAFGRIGNAVYFGLPGNPVAVMISFYVFVRDALLRMMGAQPGTPPWLRARANNDIRKRPGRTEYQRGRLSLGDDGLMQVSLSAAQGSGMLHSMAAADCIVVLGHDQGNVKAGDAVDCLAFDGLT